MNSIPKPAFKFRALIASSALAVLWNPGGAVLGAPPSQSIPATSRVQGSSADGANVTVNFANSPVAAIIPFYTQLTGKKMILDASLQGDSLRILGTRPMTKREAVLFIESSLLLNGYAILQVDDETVKLVHHSGGKNPRSEGLPVFTNERELPEGEQIVNYVMPLRHISPDEATKAFQMVTQLHAYGAITPVTNASALIITENTATIRSLVKLADVIDVPPAEISNEMITLERSDADSIAEIINQIYEEKEKAESVTRQTTQNVATAGQPGQPARPGAPAPAPQGFAQTANTNPTAAKVKVIPYHRTNQLLVIARPVDIAYIKELVSKLDQRGGSMNFMKRKLRYMPVIDFLPVARNALSRDTDIEDDSGSGETTGGSSRSRSNTNSPSTNASNGFGADTLGSSGNGRSSSGGGSGAARSVLADPEESDAPQSLVVGRTLLIADSQSNSLIVSGSTEHVQIIDQLLNEIDVRPQQIYINSLIGSLNVGDHYKIGFDMLRLLDDFSIRRGASVSTSDSTGNLQTLPGSTGTTGNLATQSQVNSVNTVNTGALGAAGAPGVIDLPFDLSSLNASQLNLYGQIGSLGNYLNLLSEDRNFKVLSRPSVYTLNNRKAVISSGQRIAVPVSTLSNVGGAVGSTAAVSSSIEYRDVVLKLEVVPLINSDDEVTLRIAQLNDNIVGEQNVSGNLIPTIGTQELVTTVTVKNGSTVVLGGLITETQGRSRRGLPILKSIPLVQYLFSVKEKKIGREELLIFIQPNIVGSRGHLDTPNHIEAGRSDIIRDTLKFGDGPENTDIPKALPVP